MCPHAAKSCFAVEKKAVYGPEKNHCDRISSPHCFDVAGARISMGFDRVKKVETDEDEVVVLMGGTSGKILLTKWSYVKLTGTMTGHFDQY